MKRTVKVDLARVNNVKIVVVSKGKPLLMGASDVAMSRMVFDGISRRKAKMIEPLRNILITSPKTGHVTNKSLAPLVHQSNSYLANMLYKIGNTLDTEDAFSVAKGRGMGGWVKPTGSKLHGENDSKITNSTWPALSEKYLYSIALKSMKNGKYTDFYAPGEKKHFWYERRRAGVVSYKDKGKALGAMAKPRLSALAEVMFAPAKGNKRLKSSLAKENRFVSGVDIRQSTVKGKGGAVAAKRSFKRADGTVVLSVKGHLLGPSHLTLSGAPMQEEFSEMILGSFANGIHGQKRVSAAPVVGSPGGDYWLFNLLKNEGRRGWMRLYSMRTGAGFHKFLGNYALREAGKRKG